MVNQRIFKIYTGRYGGELTIGEVSQDFMEYWQDKMEDPGDDAELMDHIHNVSWEDSEDCDPDSPALMYDPENPNPDWSEIDDIEHINGPYADNTYYSVEIKLHQDAELRYGEVCWKEGTDYDYSTSMYEELDDTEQGHEYTHALYSREAYANHSEPDWDEEETAQHFVPVLSVHSAEKGGFGEVYVVTDGEDFDPDKFCVGQVETDLATIIEAYWYDGVALEIDFSGADTTGKGMYVQTSWMNKKWHDPQSLFEPDGDAIKEAIEEHQDFLEWQAEQTESA